MGGDKKTSYEEDISSITSKTFKLLENGTTTKIGAAVSYSAGTQTATVDPANALKSGLSYKAVVSTGAKDVAGNPLDQNSSTSSLQQKVWFFTVSN